MKYLPAISLFVLITAFSASATTYYVDNCVTPGNDLNSGTSPASPWLTLAKVNSTPLNPGDTVLFQSGCQWNEVLAPTSSGAYGSPITYNAYGSVGGNPIIANSTRVTGWASDSGTYSWSTVWTATTQNNTSAWANTHSGPGNGGNRRLSILGYYITGKNSVIRLRLKAFVSHDTVLGNVSIGLQSGNSASFSSTPVTVTFGGIKGTTIPAGAEVTSDAISIPFNNGVNYLVNLFWPVEDFYTAYLPCISTLNSYIHITAADESLLTSGLNFKTNNLCPVLEAVEKRSSRSPIPHVYQGALIKAPVSVYRNDLLLTPVLNIAMLKMEGQWYYDSTAQMLYIYTLTKPTSTDVIDAAGGAVTGIIAQNVNYLTFKNLMVKEFTGPAIVNDGSTYLAYDTIEAKLNGSSGYIIHNGTQWLTVIHGAVHDNGWQTTGDRNGIAIGGIGNSSANITIDSVDVYRNLNSDVEVSSTNTGALMSNITVQNCLLHDSQKAGFKIDGGHTGISLLNNQIYNNAEAGYFTNSNAHGGSVVTVSNNVFSGNGAHALLYNSNVHIAADNTTFVYNTIGGAAAGVAEIDVTGSTLNSDYNAWMHPIGSTYMVYQGIKTDFYGWQAVSHEDADSTLVP